MRILARTLWVWLFTTIVTGLMAQERTLMMKRDSLIIQDESLAIDPFSLGKNPLAYLTTKIKFKSAITREPTPNMHEDNQIDTAFTIAFGDDIFNLYKWETVDKKRTANSVLFASIKTDRFKTKHGLKVGQHKAEVLSLLSRYGVKSIPRYLVFDNPDLESLTVEFQGDVLIKIEFQGVWD